MLRSIFRAPRTRLKTNTKGFTKALPHRTRASHSETAGPRAEGRAKESDGGC